MTGVRRRVMMSGLLAAFLTLVAGLLNLLVSQRWLWVLVFAAVCYPALRAIGREGDTKVSWRPELVAAALSLLALLLLIPLGLTGLAAFTIAAAVILVVYGFTAWWFSR